MSIRIDNATEVFARDNQFWEFGGYTFSKPISQTQFIWIACLALGIYVGLAVLLLILFGIAIIFTLLWAWAPALVIGIYAGKKLGDTSEKFDGMTAGKYLLAKRQWKKQARGYLDGIEYDPNAKRVYRISSMVQVSNRAYDALYELQQTEKKYKPKKKAQPRKKKGELKK